MKTAAPTVVTGWSPIPRAASIVVIGSFDGFHCGHQALFRVAQERAAATGLRCVLLTFEPHPAFVVGHPIRLLQAPAQRMAWLRRAPVDVVWVMPFSMAVVHWEPEAFIERVLLHRLQAREVVVGEDFRYGYQRRGDVALLDAYLQGVGGRVWAHPPVLQDGLPCRSTTIRERLQEGDIGRAWRLLGRPFSLWGVVHRGAGLGRELGFRTANLWWRNGVVPARGVYITVMKAGDRLLPSVSNVGVRPTVNGARLQVEAHVLDFADDLQGRAVELFFLRYLRSEQKFATLRDLQSAIRHDVAQARQFFSEEFSLSAQIDLFQPWGTYPPGPGRGGERWKSGRDRNEHLAK